MIWGKLIPDKEKNCKGTKCMPNAESKKISISGAHLARKGIDGKGRETARVSKLCLFLDSPRAKNVFYIFK